MINNQLHGFRHSSNFAGIDFYTHFQMGAGITGSHGSWTHVDSPRPVWYHGLGVGNDGQRRHCVPIIPIKRIFQQLLANQKDKKQPIVTPLENYPHLNPFRIQF